MKKILACSLCLMLVGCGSGNSQEAGNPAKDEIAIPKFEEFAEDYAAAKWRTLHYYATPVQRDAKLVRFM